ncbi:ankyrin repeat-containing domain protein [Baffinella frigidus]|nr:ankyrin repeat-containing domain protein [Cryptophyta sp. CCMP2293]
MTDAEMTAADRALWRVVDPSSHKNQPGDAQRCIAAGANVNCQRPRGWPDDDGSGYRETPLSIATAWHTPKLVKMLLEHGADTGFITTFGERTILHIAALHDRAENAGMLIEAGASVEQKETVEGWTALHLAVYKSHRHHKTVRLLLAKGANVNATDDAGRTPLYIALEGALPRFQHDLIRILLASGADLSAKTFDGRSPHDFAKEQRRPYRQDLCFLEQLLETERVRRAVAFAMGQQERLGGQSWVQHLEPGVVRMVLQYV